MYPSIEKTVIYYVAMMIRKSQVSQAKIALNLFQANDLTVKFL